MVISVEGKSQFITVSNFTGLAVSTCQLPTPTMLLSVFATLAMQPEQFMLVLKKLDFIVETGF